jgi:putative holliday junction resolvase
MPKIAAIDWGLKRIGVAVSDDRGVVALPLKMVEAGKSHEKTAKSVLAVIGPVHLIIVGWPLLLNGKEGPMAEEVRRFCDVLKMHTQCNIELFDERLSSKQAERALKEMSYSRKERTLTVDSTAAALLLQTYLDMKAIR